MREFWNQRALEDAYYFIDDRRAYRDPAAGTFWADGEHDLDRLLGLVDARLQSDDEALDIGCGVGRLTRVMAGRVARVYAIDVSSVMIERARAQHVGLDNVEWIVGDGHTLQPVRDQSVDVCISHVVFQHLPDPAVTLDYVAEMARVLRPGGWAAFQVSNDPLAHRPRGGTKASLRRLASAIGRAPRGQSNAAWLGSAIELSELRSVAASRGLVLDRVVGEGTQFCLIRARKSGDGPEPAKRRLT